MTLETTICLPFSESLVGISSLDNNIYIYQIKDQESYTILIIYQVNPLVPSSWRVFKEINLDYMVDRVTSSFNACCSKMAFICRSINMKTELLMVDMSSDQTETRPIEKLVPDACVFKFAETAVGWVALFSNYCCKMFPKSEENPILLTVDRDRASCSYDKTLTYDSFMYIKKSSNNLWKVVSYDLLSGNFTEMAFGQFNFYDNKPHILTGASDRAYLIRRSEDQDPGNRVIYKVQHDHLGIRLTYLNQLHDQFTLVGCLDSDTLEAGNDTIATIHPKSLLSVVHLGVPSLKSLAVWAVQKLYGTIGDRGALLDGISEEELNKSIGYQQNTKLF